MGEFKFEHGKCIYCGKKGRLKGQSPAFNNELVWLCKDHEFVHKYVTTKAILFAKIDSIAEINFGIRYRSEEFLDRWARYVEQNFLEEKNLIEKSV